MKDQPEIYPYVVILKNRHSGYVDLVNGLISLSSILFFTNEILFTERLGKLFLAGVFFILLVLIYNLPGRKKRKKTHYNKALFIAALIWLKMPYGQWLFLLLILLGIMEKQARASIEIGFSRTRVVFNYLLKKKVPWEELQNVVLRDNLITIDFKNNRLIQQEVEDEEDDEDVTEEEFNLFCREMLGEHTN